jgi:hypothetical protein
VKPPLNEAVQGGQFPGCGCVRGGFGVGHRSISPRSEVARSRR